MRLDQTARDLIDGPHTAILSTATTAGGPQATLVFVKYSDDAVLFSTVKGRLKARNMQRNPLVSVLVLGSSGRYVDIRGVVSIEADPDKKLAHEMYARYMGGATLPPEPEAERLIVRVTPERLYHWPPLAGGGVSPLA